LDRISKKTETSSNIIFTPLASALGPAFTGHPAYAGSLNTGMLCAITGRY